MILKIKLYYYNPQGEVDHTEECFLPEEILDKPYHFNQEFPQEASGSLKDFTVRIKDEDENVIFNDGKESIELVLVDDEKFIKEVIKDKLSIELSLIPGFEPLYDTLTASDGKETLTYTADDFDSENRQFRYHSNGELVPWLEDFTVFEFDDKCTWILAHSKGNNVLLDNSHTHENKQGVNFDLSSNSVKIYEYDPIEEIVRVYHIGRDLFDRSFGEANAAYRIAELIAQQSPEALEIIARYMEDAAELGSIEAMDWLADYHSDDGKFDA